MKNVQGSPDCAIEESNALASTPHAATSRRSFLQGISAGLSVACAGSALAKGVSSPADLRQVPPAPGVDSIGDRVDPWIEVDGRALQHNVRAISTKVGHKPVLAVLKCNAYGMDPAVVAPLLEPVPELWGYAVAKAEEGFAARAAGVRKPIVMLADFRSSDVPELVRQGIALCTVSEASGPRLVALAKKLGRPIPIHAKVDVGLGRLGIQTRVAPKWIAALIDSGAVKVEGIFCNLVEIDRATKDLENFKSVVESLRSKGYATGPAHAAASWAIAHVPGSALDMVRPGLMTYGCYPDDAPTDFVDLHTMHRLRGRVIRVARLEPGEGVGYGQGFIAKESTWVATIMCGWSDGYNYKPNSGCEVAINGKLYPLVGRTANNTVVQLGLATEVKEGDVATLVGPDAGIRPNELGDKSDIGGYNQIRYSALLPKYLSA